jgi:hypothetical protein
MATIINLQNADGRECTCDGSTSWLEHWEIRKGVTAIYCRACLNQKDLVGTHVKKSESPNEGLFIVPCCEICFQKEELNVWSYNELVPAECEQNK